jgi:hypothetical protein
MGYVRSMIKQGRKASMVLLQQLFDPLWRVGMTIDEQPRKSRYPVAGVENGGGEEAQGFQAAKHDEQKR